MLVADTHLGHADDPDVAARLADADPHRVVLSDVERRRSRVRTETRAGRDLGVVVARDLGDGDVLETEDGALVVVELAAVDAMAVPVADCEPEAALELGHALGNRHLDLAVRDGEALIPTDGSRTTVETVVETVLPDADYRYRDVAPTTFDDEPDHAHDHSHDASGAANDPLARPRRRDGGDES